MFTKLKLALAAKDTIDFFVGSKEVKLPPQDSHASLNLTLLHTTQSVEAERQLHVAIPFQVLKSVKSDDGVIVSDFIIMQSRDLHSWKRGS